MPALHNQRHEAFARAVAEGKSLASAYAAAGYRRHAANPTRLKGRREIDERIREIEATQQLVQEKAVERAIDAAAITRAGVLQMLIEDHSLAREKGQIGAAIRAAELLGKELGMFVDRRHLDVSFEQRLATMTPEQRMELARDMAVKMKEQVARYREIEGQASEVTPDEGEVRANDPDRPRD